MATKDKEPKKKGKGGGDRKSEQPKVAHTGVGTPAPAPRLRGYYQNTVRERLAKQFELKNPHQIPGLEKIVINVGLGEAIKQPKLLDKVVEELGVKEQMIFPEINYDMIDAIHGMDVTFVTTTERDDQAYALLRELGMPFRGDDKPIVVNP